MFSAKYDFINSFTLLVTEYLMLLHIEQRVESEFFIKASGSKEEITRAFNSSSDTVLENMAEFKHK